MRAERGDNKSLLCPDRRTFIQSASGAALAGTTRSLAAIGGVLGMVGGGRAIGAPCAAYLFDQQQRKDIQTRARWAAINGRPNATPPGASCGPVTNLVTGYRAPVVPRGNFQTGPWTLWEECYAIPGTNYYLRLAWECGSIPVGYCPIQVTQPKGGCVKHFNITVAQQGWWPDNFNYNNPNNRRVIDNEHIAIWEDSTTKKLCVVHYADVNAGFTGPGFGKVCRWSSCGAPPFRLFSPWTADEAVRFFRAGLQGLGKLLSSLSIDPNIVDGIILLIGEIVVVALVLAAIILIGEAAAAAAGFAVFAF